MSGIAQAYRRDRSRRAAAYVMAGLAIVGLLSAASRPLRGRLADLLVVFPFLVPRAASVTLVFVSFALVLAARGLRRGHRVAWTAALILLLGSTVLHLMKGLDISPAVLSAGCAVWLATQHRAFPVLPSRLTVGKTAAVAVAGTAVTVAVAIILAARVDRLHHRGDLDETVDRLADRLGGQHALPVDFGGHFAPPVLIAIGLAAIAAALWLLLSPRTMAPLTGEAHRKERERARALVARYGGGTLDYFALRDDKQWFFVGESMVSYVARGGVCLVSPDPIGPPDEREQTWVEFMAHAERSGWSVTVLGAASAWLSIYEATGLHEVYLGDEAVVNCRAFRLEGRPMRGLRQAYRRVQRAGYTTSFQDPATLDEPAQAELLALSTQSRRGEVERGFSMTLSRLFDPDDTGLLLSVARDSTGRAQAFVQWVPATDIGGWSLDVMRRSTAEDIPNGLTDFLIIETIHHVQATGGDGLGLNFAMFRRVVAGESDSRLARAAQALLRQASSRAQIESLWRFNAKYEPSWVPRYAVIGSIDALASQGFVMADAEGVTEIPVVGRFMNRGSRG
jgi:lysyl-tRNA synthetase class 2